MSALTDTLSGFTAMSDWEFIAVGLSMAYIVLAIKQSLWCWPAAFFSTLIYTILFYNGALLMESVLNVYYMAMAVYGWFAWQGQNNKSGGADAEKALPIGSWSLQRHLKIVLSTSLISILIGFLMSRYTHADFAYLDSFTTCFAVMTTYLLAQKILENWIYWVIIDAASIYLYVEKGYYPTVVLFVCYTLMAVWGFYTWSQQYKKTKPAENASVQQTA